MTKICLMVMMEIVYAGGKKCSLTHEEGAKIQTDAPKDIGGEASAFSPTDLLGAALGSCILTTMGMFAERHEVDISGAKVHVVKEMTSDSARRIKRLSARITIPQARVPLEMREALERVGKTCPVHKSLHPDIEIRLEFVYE